MPDRSKQVSLDKRLKNIRRELKEVTKAIGQLPENLPITTTSLHQQGVTRHFHGRTDDQSKVCPLSQKDGSLEKNNNVRIHGRGDAPNLPANERFVDYLSANIEIGVPLRYQRRQQRNRFIVLFIVIIIAVLWLAGYLIYKL